MYKRQTLDYANLIFDGFMELHGDRHFSDDGEMCIRDRVWPGSQMVI